MLTNNAAYAGFSSATGAFASRHYILGWSFQLNGEAAELDYSALSFKTIQDELAQLVPPPSFTNSEDYKAILYAVLLPTALGIAMVLSAITVKVLMKRMSKSKEAKMEWEREYGPPSFTYKDLLAATSGFKDKMLLGRGGFGSVFKGALPHSKQTIAVKLVSPESKQGMKEFIAEIAILGHLRHAILFSYLGIVSTRNNSFWCMTICPMEASTATCILNIRTPPIYSGLKGSTSSKVLHLVSSTSTRIGSRSSSTGTSRPAMSFLTVR